MAWALVRHFGEVHNFSAMRIVMQNFTVNPRMVECFTFEEESGRRVDDVITVEQLNRLRDVPGRLFAVVTWDGGRTDGDNGDWEVPISFAEADFIMGLKSGTIQALLVVTANNEIQTFRM